MQGGERAAEPASTSAAHEPADGAGVAVVLAGAGARGAYEAGALSVILPALGQDQPNIYVGASVGSINSVAFSSLSHLDPAAASAKALELWRSIHQSDIFRSPLVSLPSAAVRRVAPGGRAARRPGCLFDTAPLHETLTRLLDWDRLHANIRDGHVLACGVVATTQSTHRSKVFLESLPSMAIPREDSVRGISFSPSRLTPAHVVGSSAIPALFPAVDLEEPGGEADWCVDGGVRLNTPIKPALMLGGRRIVVIATAPASLPKAGGDGLRRVPGITSGMVDILRALTVDPMVEDLRSLVHDNQRAAGASSSGSPGGWPRTIEYVFTGPPRADQLGRLAGEVLRAGRGWSPTRLVGRRVADSPDLGELASYVLFHPDFIAGAIELGQQDARTHLHSGSMLWRTTELPEGS